MRIVLCLFTILLTLSSQASAEEITVEITSLSNIRQNGAMEACGTATHVQGVHPLLVTVKHDESYYSILTAPNNKWCVLIKRWTFSGRIEVGATTLNSSASEFESLAAAPIRAR